MSIKNSNDTIGNRTRDLSKVGVSWHTFTECGTQIAYIQMFMWFFSNNNNNNNNNNDNNNNVPKSVETIQGGKVTILWNQQVQTDRTIPNNKPDIIIRDNEKRTYMLIELQSQETEM